MSNSARKPVAQFQASLPRLRIVDRAEPPWGQIDTGIIHEVRVLWDNGIETHESCEGTAGHSFTEPTVRFLGGHAEGFKALAIAMQFGLKVVALRHYWEIIDGVPTGPHWEMVFHHADGGGIHAVESDGKITWEWGRAKEKRRNNL
jgi:hypothetical protein